jgi:predicted O-methyltransferase YrrM
MSVLLQRQSTCVRDDDDGIGHMKGSNRQLEDLRRTEQSLAKEKDLRPEWLRALDDDPTSVYYRFFFECATTMKPLVSLEIGTCEGKSAAHLATGYSGGTVITIDIRPESKTSADRLLLPNVVSIVGDSLEIPHLLKWMPVLDLLFIDGQHDLRQAYREYLLYRPYVREGGLVYFDDIRINSGMERLWEVIQDPKTELPSLHYTGFGVAMKDSRIAPISLEEAMGEAQRR